MDYERITKMLDKTYGWAMNRTFSREEADELTQEILYQAIKSYNNLQDSSKFEPWFWRLAEITLKVFKRGKAKTRSLMSLDDVANLAFEDEHSFMNDDDYQSLRHNIAKMSASYRNIIVMHYYDNMSCKDISQKLGIPEGTVTYRLSLARGKLKKECNQMNESALRPAQLKIRISGECNYNGNDKPFPWQYIDDALSQNILCYAYREPRTVERLSELTGVPAFYIEERINNLLKRDAVIQPTKSTVQSNFLIYDNKTSSYETKHSKDVVIAVSEQFYSLSYQLTEKLISFGVQSSGRSFDEMLCLLSVMLLDQFVPEYKPSEYTPIKQKYDGYRWEYSGVVKDQAFETTVGIGMEKSMNNYDNGKLAHYSYHFTPFTYRKMMYDHEVDVCHRILMKEELSEKDKENAAKLIAEHYLAITEAKEVLCTIPVFTKEDYEMYIVLARELFANFLPFYTDQINQYMNGYIKLFPKHLKAAAHRTGFHIYVAMFKAIVEDWIHNGRIQIPRDAVCDVLIMQ